MDECKADAKNLVGTNDFGDAALQNRNIERSLDAKAYGDVPAGIARLKAVKIPERFLRQSCGETVERLAQCADIWFGTRCGRTNLASGVHVTCPEPPHPVDIPPAQLARFSPPRPF